MSQDVIIVGKELSELVPFSLACHGPEYAVTLAPSDDVIAGATSFASKRSGWIIVLTEGDETLEACAALHKQTPLVLFVTSPLHDALRRNLVALDLPVICEDEGPLVVLASLVATARWLESAPAKNSLAEPGRLTPGSAG